MANAKSPFRSMSNIALVKIFSLIIGSVIVIGGVAVKGGDLVDRAEAVAAGANIHQLATVLELYHLDHDEYPDVRGGEALVDVLERERYIKTRPREPGVFWYESKDNGQDYLLEIPQ